jgi:cytochrome b561
MGLTCPLIQCCSVLASSNGTFIQKHARLTGYDSSCKLHKIMETIMASHDYSFPLSAKILHGGMAIFGVTAYLSAELAENGSSSSGYYLHAYLGLSLTAFILLRIFRGFSGPEPMRFSGWSPFSSRQWSLALQDVRSLIQLRVPERGMHEGLAGLTQAFGLALFGWMGLTGTGLFLLDDNPKATLFEIVEELHEIGESLIPLYLALHVGSVLVHSMAGKPIWQRMWKFGSNN